MLKTKTARPAKAGSPNLAKAETATEPRAGDQYFSRAVGKALEVLEFLQAELKPMSMNDIAQRIQLSKTSAFRILRTLETLGCVVVDGRGQYILAPGIHAVTPTQWLGKLHRVGVPYLEALSRELAETSTLAALFENLKDGASIDQFLEWFPGVTRAQVEALLDYELTSLTNIALT